MIDIFVSNSDIVRDASMMATIIPKFFPKLSVVCGIPRGGNLPANIISTRLGIPCNTPDLLMQGQYWWTTSLEVPNNRNYRTTEYTVSKDFSKANILLVDDTSFNRMGTLEKCKQAIYTKFPNAKVYKSSVYSMWDTKKSLDLYCKIISRNHWFEKDFLIRKIGGMVGADMDGFLCYDPINSIVMNDQAYLEWNGVAVPYMIPYWKIDYVITARLDKYRKQTEKWLDDNNVKYDCLVMQEGTKRVGTDHAKYKSEAIAKYLVGRGKDPFYIESSTQQAQSIYKYCNTQTFAIETMQLFGATNIEYAYNPMFEGKSKFVHPNKESNEMLGVNKPREGARNWLFH